MIKRFDLVKIRTIENVKWLSGPAGRPASPQGNWSVVAGIGKDTLILSKDETVIQIPATDVLKIADYSAESVVKRIKSIRSMEDIKNFKMKPDGGDNPNDYLEVEG